MGDGVVKGSLEGIEAPETLPVRFSCCSGILLTRQPECAGGPMRGFPLAEWPGIQIAHSEGRTEAIIGGAAPMPGE